MKNNELLITLVCLIIYFSTGVLNASNHVTVATIGGKPPAFEHTDDMQEVVEKVKEFWSGRIGQVLPDRPDLIVLTELSDHPRGLSEDELSRYYDVRQDQINDFLAKIASDNHCYIAYGTKRKDQDGRWRNSVVMVDRKGIVAGIYNKNYPTIGEMKGGIVPGENVPLFECDFGTVAAAVCFDLNFMELCEKYSVIKPDIIVFPSAYHGGNVQSHWAYETRAFFIGSINSRYTPSEIRNPLGEVVASSTNYYDFAVASINLDNQLVHLDYNKSKLTALKAKYGEGVTISDPGKLGAVMVTSENEKVSVDDMVEEFDLELLDDYLDRSRNFRKNKLPGNEVHSP